MIFGALHLGRRGAGRHAPLAVANPVTTTCRRQPGGRAPHVWLQRTASACRPSTWSAGLVLLAGATGGLGLRRRGLCSGQRHRGAPVTVGNGTLKLTPTKSWRETTASTTAARCWCGPTAMSPGAAQARRRSCHRAGRRMAAIRDARMTCASCTRYWRRGRCSGARGLAGHRCTRARGQLRIVVPFARARARQRRRVFGEAVRLATGRTVIVDDKPGAHTSARSKSRAPADGRRCCSHRRAPQRCADAQAAYDPVDGFTLIMLLTRSRASADRARRVAVHDIQEFLARRGPNRQAHLRLVGHRQHHARRGRAVLPQRTGAAHARAYKSTPIADA